MEKLDFMAYALIPDPGCSGRLYAGLANGDIWETDDYGDAWKRFPVSMGSIHRTMIPV